MTTPSISPLVTQPTSSSSSMSQFASIQVHDALIKFSLYLQKLTTLQQSPSSSTEQKCHKLVRLLLQSFIKYSETEQFSRQSYQLIKTCIIMKKSYYSFIMMDLMMKNNKYVIKQVKKQLEAMFKFIWEKVVTEIDREVKQGRLENLKMIVRCWGFIFGDKLQENIRKWLEGKYGVKKIELTQENEKLLKEVYGDKIKQGTTGKPFTTERESKLSEALLNSLIENDNSIGNNSMYLSNSNMGSSYVSHSYLQNRQSFTPSDPRMYRYQASFGQVPMMNSSNPQTNNNDRTRPPHSTNLLSNSNNGIVQSQTTKPKSLQGMNKSLLEALDLS